MPVITVPVKSAAKSKINWTAIISAVAVLAATFGFDIPEEVQGDVVAAIAAVSAAVIVIFRTWFNNSATK